MAHFEVIFQPFSGRFTGDISHFLGTFLGHYLNDKENIMGHPSNHLKTLDLDQFGKYKCFNKVFSMRNISGVPAELFGGLQGGSLITKHRKSFNF